MRHAGWERHRTTDRHGNRSWCYRHAVLLSRSTVELAVRDLLDQRAITFYQRKADATSAPSALQQLIDAVNAAGEVAALCDFADKRCVVMPIERWQAIIDAAQ